MTCDNFRSTPSVEAFFKESEARNLRMVAGKVLMDRNCPDFLQDTAEGGIRESEDLLKKWHKRGRHKHVLGTRIDLVVQALAEKYEDVHRYVVDQLSS